MNQLNSNFHQPLKFIFSRKPKIPKLHSPPLQTIFQQGQSNLPSPLQQQQRVERKRRRRGTGFGLLELTRNFLQLGRSREDHRINLNEDSVRLGVDKRRLYDVTNILEAVGVVRKIKRGVVEVQIEEMEEGEDLERERMRQLEEYMGEMDRMQMEMNQFMEEMGIGEFEEEEKKTGESGWERLNKGQGQNLCEGLEQKYQHSNVFANKEEDEDEGVSVRLGDEYEHLPTNFDFRGNIWDELLGANSFQQFDRDL